MKKNNFKIRSSAYKSTMCLDALDDKESELRVKWCHSRGGTQFWDYYEGFLRKDDYCIVYEDELKVIRCKLKRRNNRVG